jgi:RimJ/RimL family protein N-acetyltransferase
MAASLAAPVANTDRCLGMVNCHDGSTRVAIGNIIDPAHHRKGIRPGVAEMLDFSFGELGIDRVQAFIHRDNVARGGQGEGRTAEMEREALAGPRQKPL